MANKRKKAKIVAKRKIGILHSGSPGNLHHDEPIKAFKAGLKAAGYDSNKLNIVGPLFADDDPQKLEDLADALINTHQVEVLIAAGGTRAAQAAETATTTKRTPVVFTSVRDHTRYPDNMTGICALTSVLDPERLGLLHELMPGSTMIGALTNSSRPNFQAEWLTLLSKAATLNVSLSQQDVPSPHNPAPGQIDDAIRQAFENFSNAGVKPVLVTADPLFNNHRKKIIDAATKHKIPAIYQWRQFAVEGGLMSYGTKLVQAYEIAGNYVGLILDGAKPASLEVLELKPQLVINLKTAKAIGITVPPLLLARADEKIP